MIVIYDQCIGKHIHTHATVAQVSNYIHLSISSYILECYDAIHLTADDLPTALGHYKPRDVQLVFLDDARADANLQVPHADDAVLTARGCLLAA